MPGQTSVTYNNTELSVAMSAQEESLNRMKDHPYLVVEDCLANSEELDGGERIIGRYTVDDHSVSTRVQSGMEMFNNFAQPTLVPAQQTWGIVVMPIYVSSVDEKKYGGSREIIKLVQDRTETVQTTMQRLFQNVILRGPAASGTWPGVPGWEDFLTLNGADGNALGLIEAASSGTNTLHGLSKATYPAATHPQFHNFFRGLAGTAGTTGLNGLYASTIDAKLKEGTPNSKESMWYWSALFSEFMKRALRSEEHYIANGEMDDGMRVAEMAYGGVKVRPTAELPNTGSTTTAAPWSAVRVNWKKGIKLKTMSGWKFVNDPFVNLPGTVGGRYALRKFWGQFWGSRVGACALLNNGEAF